MRHMRDLFNALNVTQRPRGKWLTLLSEDEAKVAIKQQCAGDGVPRAALIESALGQQDHNDKVCLLTAKPRQTFNPEDERVVRLPSGFSFEIVRD